jgi:Domain of unknown function (DUF4287)/Domain of unknown function (DUF5655)
MPKIAPQNLTEQQRKWFASLRDGLQRETGKSLAEWIAIAKTCPESRPRARLKWFKETHGLLQNRASYVLGEAFPAASGWDQPDALKSALWSDASSRTILAAVEKIVLALPNVIASQRKGYSAWSRKYQFAALRPVRGGMARLGLALMPDGNASLQPPKNEGWSERLKASVVLKSPRDVDKRIAELLRAAWSAS